MKKLLGILLLGSTLLAGCGDSREEYVFTNTGQVAVAPVARNDAYTTAEDTSLSVPIGQGVLVNDTLNATSAANVVVSFPQTTVQGGTVTLGANTGAFTYTPAAGYFGTDSFTYTLSNGFASSTATVTITVTQAQVQAGFFVDAASGNDGTGDFETGAPFATIQAAVADAPENADIVVRPGNYTGTVDLKNGQRLLGSGSELANGQGGARPELAGPIVLGDGNTLDFLRIEGANGDAVDGDGQNSGTVTNSELTSTTNVGSGVQARGVSGTWTIENNTMSNLAGLGVELSTEGTSQATAFINDNTITGNAFNALGFISSDSSQLKVQVNDNLMTGNQPGATFEVITADTSTSGFQILGNQNDDVYRLSTLDPTAQINVEQLGQLETLNSGTIFIPGGSVKDPVSVAAGSLGF